MESNFAQVQREEYISKKIGLYPKRKVHLLGHKDKGFLTFFLLFRHTRRLGGHETRSFRKETKNDEKKT